MGKAYSLEFAVMSPTELQAMERLEELGITKAKEAKLSDLDRQAELFIIRVDAEESELTDEVYGMILADKDVFILSDELSAKRAREIIRLTTTVEQQLKKLLICVLPETEKVLNDIIEAHQRHKTDLKPTSRIQWCEKINNFSFGELPKVLEEDISELAKQSLLSNEGLLSLINSANDFEALKATIAELSKPKTVWNSMCAILENAVEYSHISHAIIKLCAARNDASHMNTITAKRVTETIKNKKHVMRYISSIKSDYRENLRLSMKNLTESMNHILESAIKIDPAIFTGYNKMISDIFKPLTETISKLELSIVSPGFIDSIKENTDYQMQIAKSFTNVIDNMKPLADFQETMKQFANVGFSGVLSATAREASMLNLDLKQLTDINTERKSDTNSDRNNNEPKGNKDKKEKLAE